MILGAFHLSFFTGMRLTITDAGFFDATPIKLGKLVDFCLHRCTLEDAVEIALAYIDSEGLKTLALERLKAVIHANILYTLKFQTGNCFCMNSSAFGSPAFSSRSAHKH